MADGWLTQRIMFDSDRVVESGTITATDRYYRIQIQRRIEAQQTVSLCFFVCLFVLFLFSVASGKLLLE